jgi:cytochrome d ubiquinol oxidase subunit I
LLGYIGLYVFLLISYIQALRYLASKPAQSLSLLPKDTGDAVAGKSS